MKNFILAVILIAGFAVSSCKNQKKDGISLCEDYTLSELGQRRSEVLKGMEATMGELPEIPSVPPKAKVLDSLKEDTYTRYTISFTAAENEKVPAYLYVPFQQDSIQKLPAMLVLHGTGDLGKQLVDGRSPKANRAHAKELAQRGYVVVAPDYPSMGDSRDYDFENDRYVSGTMKGIFNHIRCIDLLQARLDVDPERIGVIGHSLGGHNAMFVGAFDTRLKVIVSSSGWTLFEHYDVGEEVTARYGGKLGPWALAKYMPLIRDKYDLDPEKIPFDFDGVLTAIVPRAFFSNSPLNDHNFNIEGVKKAMDTVSKIYKCFGEEGRFQASYPDAGHDFPTETRSQAYLFIDEILGHTPNQQEIE